MNETPGTGPETGPEPEPGRIEAAQTSLFSSPPPSPSDPPPASVRLEIDDDGIGWVVFDVPGKPVNLIDARVMEDLRAALDEAARKQVRALALVSDKPDMFIAGADVSLIAGIDDPASGEQKAKQGQSLFEAVARFPRPTAAVVNGPCVGGGYELALACTWIVAEDTPAVSLGLPEVRLGILPGFGGTQRLPRRVGLRAALDVILAGKTLPARRAFRRGMADALVPPGSGRGIAREILLGRRTIRRRPRPRVERLLERIPFVRRFVLDRARDAMAKRVREDHYPASYRALESIAASYSLDEVEAYGTEARLLGELIVSPTSKNLTWLFLQQGQSKTPEGLSLEPAHPVRRMAVVGAGVMGGGIAWLAGERGIPIRIKDIAAEALAGAIETAGRLWSRQVQRRRLTPRDRDRRLEALSFTLDYTGFATVDLVVEAVVESLPVKHAVFRELEQVVKSGTVIASNTSSLRIGDIATGSTHPERVVGLHFFNPVDRMPLVEVIAGPRSDPAAVATAYRLALDLKKTPILVQDGPGFLVNRLLAFYLGEAIHLLESGADVAAVDRVLTEFGMPMGPFELLDQIGLDVAEKVTQVMGDAFGDRLPSQATVTRLSAKGSLGKKSGRGFYLYAKGKKQGPSSEARSAAGNPASRDFTGSDILDRLILPMVNEAARCLEDGIVHRPLDVDLGMVMGTGFPPFRGGLLRYADDRGVKAILDRLDVLAESVGARFAPSPALRGREAGFYSG